MKKHSKNLSSLGLGIEKTSGTAKPIETWKPKKKTAKQKALIFIMDFAKMIIEILIFISKHFWKIFAIVLVIFLISKYASWNSQRMDKIETYWDEQQELCGQVGYFSETGERVDCQPLDHIKGE